VAEALRAAGCTVEIHDRHFAQDAKDAEWLPEVGRRGWVVLTKDRHIRTRQSELIKLAFAVPMRLVRAANDPLQIGGGVAAARAQRAGLPSVPVRRAGSAATTTCSSPSAIPTTTSTRARGSGSSP
jgi:hypothetical protein